jgi:hypothetical protein
MFRWAMVAIVLCGANWSGAAEVSVSTVRLDVAVEQELVEVKINGRGACSGDAVQVEVRRKVKRTLHLVVEPGTVMECKSGTVQNMICYAVKYQKKGDQYERVDVMVLDDDHPQIFLLEAFCGSFEKPTPKPENSFRLAAVDVQATTVIVKGKKAQVSIRTIQTAVWLRSDVPEAEIRRRFKATDVELRAAGLLVQSASATERGDHESVKRIEQELRIVLSGVLAAVQERLAQRPFRRGDKVQVVAESTPVRTLRSTLGTAKQGDTFEVIAVFPQRVSVDFQAAEGEAPVRGLIAIADLQLVDGAPRGAGRPVLRELGELVSETELEVVTIAERGY